MDQSLTEQMLAFVRAVGARQAQEYLAAGILEQARYLDGTGDSRQAERCKQAARYAMGAANDMAELEG